MDSGVRIAEEIGELISFETEDLRESIEIIDHIERCHCRIDTSQPVSPIDISTDEFYFPVDRGIKIKTESLSVPYSLTAFIRNHSGLLVDELTEGEYRDFPYDQYSIELSASVKLYISTESGFEIQVESEKVFVDFNNYVEIKIGVRSYHERPGATIKTTEKPRDIMKAVSYLGSALKTKSCERSYPTLRGHPPEIETNDRRHIPSILEKPETGVTIKTPENYRSIFVTAPLAYYLGASIVPSQEPKIITSNGFTYTLNNTTRGFENEVERVLKQCFFLDCITRTEGYYPVRLHERKQIEKEVALDFKSLYGQPLVEQLKEYLNIPYEIVEPHLPQWKQTAYIESKFENISMIPFVINDLSVIHSAKETEIDRSTINNSQEQNQNQNQNSIEISEFVRNNVQMAGVGGISTTKSRPIQTRGEQTTTLEEYIQIQETDSLEQTWIGDGIPIGASKAVVEAFKNRFQRTPTDGDISITVIVNDTDMIEEGHVADNVYDSREKLSFSVNAHQQMTTSELLEVLQTDTDFLHYIGHIDDEGFKCIDGQLDIRNIDDTGVDAFFLNACSSYQQALELIQSGAIAGIATVQPVLNSGAQRIGKAIARLLNLGFPLISALKIAKSESIMGENYVVVGDGGLDLAQAKSGIPSLCEISKDYEEEIFNMDYITYPTRRKNMGSITIPYVNENQTHFLTSGSTGEFKLDINELLRFISGEQIPIKIESMLYWSDEISTKTLSFD